MIDGQQRIRSLVYAFNETDLDDEGDQDESIGTMGQDVQETKRRLWCVNLTRVPILKNYLAPLAKDSSLFVFATDPEKADPHSLLRFNIMPWRFLREHENYDKERGAFDGRSPPG